MSGINQLDATARAGVGKGAARAARREGLVPGVIYGGGEQPTPVNMKMNELLKLLKKGRFLSTPCQLNVGGNVVNVMPREVQKNVLNGLPTHVDFLRLKAGSTIVLEIPVEFINHEASPGLKAGGTLNITRHAVEVHCDPANIPDKLVADLTGLGFNDVVKWSMLSPKGMKPVITGRDFAIATVLPAKTGGEG